VRDLLKHWKPSQSRKIFLLKDCCSSLPGFESKAEEFIQDIFEQGVTVMNSTEAFEWPEPDTVSEVQPEPSSAPAAEDDDLDEDGEEDAGEMEGTGLVNAADAEGTEQTDAVDIETDATAEGNNVDPAANGADGATAEILEGDTA